MLTIIVCKRDVGATTTEKLILCHCMGADMVVVSQHMIAVICITLYSS